MLDYEDRAMEEIDYAVDCSNEYVSDRAYINDDGNYEFLIQIRAIRAVVMALLEIAHQLGRIADKENEVSQYGLTATGCAK